MDQIKIGRFIAMCRKERGMTQAALAERLGITDRAVSKWENGRSMPDSSIMLALCDMLGITVNDLLSGERVEMENYDKAAEANLLAMKRELEANNRFLLRMEYVVGFGGTIAYLALLFAGCCLVKERPWQIALIALAIAMFAVAIGFGMRIERSVGYYRCAKCGHRYVPNALPFWFSMHIGRTRFMKCPHCGAWSWQRKVLSVEETSLDDTKI